MMKRLIWWVIFFSCWGVLLAQGTIFPGLSGPELLDSLVARYKPPFVLDYNTARDSMYAYIDNHNDSVRGVYTGYTIYVPHGAPNPRHYTNNADPIINTEHTWPRSKGATGMAGRDLHHLFPTNAVANAARGSLPFGESPDNMTDRWYRNTEVRTTIPPAFIDEYSELDFNTRFEPREDHKGNVARAMFYFYTMYRQKADSADPAFFNIQKNTLRMWNLLDPVDSAEIARTYAIAHFQGGAVNPFVLDTTLIGRAYFGVPAGIGEARGDAPPADYHLYPNHPNPFNPITNVEFRMGNPRQGRGGAAWVTLKIYDLRGRVIKTLVNRRLTAGHYTVQWDGTDDAGQSVAGGIYLYQLRIGEQFARTRKMVLIR
ncbi:MAG: hypothetical protein D6681_10645 [Calditrichaeota bacterium]|nr:MAG: hypothetical protein D6681_10645 [Calditrichota bacterium]